MRIERAEWDSIFFNLEVGYCQVSEKDSWDPRFLGNWDLIYFFIAPGNEEGQFKLEECGAYCVDRKVTYIRGVTPSLKIDSPCIRSYTSTVFDPILVELGLEAGQYSRFKIDPKITPSQFSDLFKAWVNRSISREFADEVLVTSDKETKITGFISLTRKGETTHIGLVAVNPLSRGLGIGRELVSGAIDFARSHSCKHLEVKTQEGNGKACGFYEHLGFKKKDTVLIYHYWK